MPRCQGFGANQQKVQPAQSPEQFCGVFFPLGEGSCSLFHLPAKASSRFSSCREPYKMRLICYQVSYPLAIGTKLHEWCGSTGWFCCCSSIPSCRGSPFCELAWFIIGFHWLLLVGTIAIAREDWVGPCFWTAFICKGMKQLQRWSSVKTQQIVESGPSLRPWWKNCELTPQLHQSEKPP